ncbi:MAG: PQQ-binding-like beta-propeller repeat protein [Gammaproteobacteria bacterium]|nr:PQQ-binding-like beta-propeller repeat protein [Gammaproteobacteria bacterium]
MTSAHRILALIPVVLLAACDRSPAPDSAASRDAGYGYDFPAPQDAPWPEFRHDRRNTGRTRIEARYQGDAPWMFQTGKGIFSPPAIGGDGSIYVGSADRFFYALDRRGGLRWKFETGEIIDSAAALTAAAANGGVEAVTFGSGDEYIYQLATADGALLWKTRAQNATSSTQLVNWWEGHVVHGRDGTLYAGNTGGAAYALKPDGGIKWFHAVGNSVWGVAAEADDGSTYWASLDPQNNVFALNADGSPKWSKPIAAFATAPPSIGADGTVYASSFDGQLYALDPATGVQKWAFQTGDHVYAGTALIDDPRGERIVLASADGSVYCLDAAGALRWRYDTGDAIRSSPAVGRAPAGEDRDIVYVGASDGRLYALNADDGTRRWSFDTTAHDDPVLRDRNDLNASPALGASGVVIAGEHGQVWYVPYDWCLHAADARCDTRAGETFADELAAIYYVTPGGNTRPYGPAEAFAGTPLPTTRFVLRQGGQTQDGRLFNPLPTTAESLVGVTPPFDFVADLSGDGHFLHIAPTGFLEPDTDYELTVSAPYLVGAPAAGAAPAGTVTAGYRFRSAPAGEPLPLSVGPDRVSAFNLARLAVPLPAFLPSINQIGFDSYDWIVGTLDKTAADPGGEGRVLLWVIGALRDGAGFPQVNASGRFEFRFPLQGRYRNNDLLLANNALSLTFSFGEVPMESFNVYGRLGADMVMRQPALHVDVFCPDVPTYGPLLNLFKLCNARQHLPVAGTYLTRAYPPQGDANVRPANLAVTAFTLTPPTAVASGSVDAALVVTRGSYRADRHAVSILLVDADSGVPVAVDYQKSLAVAADAAGNVRSARLALPAGTTLPPAVKAYLIADVFPVQVKALSP